MNTVLISRPPQARSGEAFGPHIVALLIGLVAFFVVFGPEFALVRVPFLANPVGDVAAEMAGYFHFAHDGWHWPLFSLPNINEPEGANQLFIGGVPILAFVAKLIAAVSGRVPNLFGLWYLLCFVLQAHALFFLMRQITREQPYVLAVASVVGVLSYAFLTRIGHVSLFGQFLVIYAMGLVIATTRSDASAKNILIKMAVLVFVALFVFAYLAIDNIVLFGTALVSLYWRRRLSLFQAAIVGTCFAVALVAIAAAGGYFWAVGRAEPVDISSYGALGLNLGSLVIPPRSILFPNNALFNNWWEGNFYLGLGILLLWALLLWVAPRVIWRVLVRNWPVVLILALLTVYCISNQIEFGATHLFSYRLPKFMAPVVGMARSAGRLFWPLGYFLMAAAIALTVHKYRLRAFPMVIAVVALACAEATGTYAFVQSKVHTVPPVSLNYAGLAEVMDQHRKMLVYPSFWCDPGADDSPKRLTHQQLEFLGARANLASNSAITARKMKDCGREAASVPVVRDGDLAIFLAPSAARASYASHPRDVTEQCRSFQLGGASGVMCSTAWSRNTLLPIPELAAVSSLQSSLKPGDAIDFSAKGNSANFIGNGWWMVPDENLTWTEGEMSSLTFRLPDLPSAELSLAIDTIAFVSGARLPNRTVEVLVNDQLLATWEFRDSSPSEKRLDLPAGLDGQVVMFSMRQSASPSPKELGLNGDPRHLGLGVRQIVLRRR